MTDKLVQTTAQIVSANKQAYSTLTTAVTTPSISANITITSPITTEVESNKVLGTVVNMGEEAQPNPSSFKRASDYATLSDSVQLQVSFKLLKTEVLNTSDTISALLTFNRTFTELQTTNDSYRVLRFGKTLIESKVLTELVNKKTNKNITETVVKAEQFRLGYNKSVVEAVTKTDIVNLDYRKVISENINIGEVFIAISKFSRNFSELLDATDDFYGLANLDDDQIASVQKVTVDSITNSEVLQVKLSITKTDQAAAIEQTYLRLTKPFIDQLNSILDQTLFKTTKTIADSTRVYTTVTDPTTNITIAADLTRNRVGKLLLENTGNYDTFTKKVTKRNQELLNTQELFSVSNSKQNRDYVTNSDSLEILWNTFREIADSFTSTDNTTLQTNKNIQDSLNSSDTTSLNSSKVTTEIVNSTDILTTAVEYNKSLLDFVGTTDDFYGAANIDDDQIAAVSKVINDTTNSSELLKLDNNKNLSDSITANSETYYTQVSLSKTEQTNILDVISFFKSTGRTINDLMAANDSGFINNQNYFTGTYVEPGYVGNNTYFS